MNADNRNEDALDEVVNAELNAMHDRRAADQNEHDQEELRGRGRYSLAFVKEDGSWDIVQTFVAVDDIGANEWAEQHYSGQDWYVLDWAGRNINS